MLAAQKLEDGRRHLGILAQRLVGPMTGVPRYIHELLTVWSNCSLPFSQVTLWAPAPIPTYGFRSVVGGNHWPRFLWEHIWVARKAKQLGVQVLFCPANIVPCLFPGRSVLTIHDTIHARRPLDFPFHSHYLLLLYWLSAKRATKIVVPSRTTAIDVERYYGVPRAKISVTPLACSSRFFDVSQEVVEAVRARYNLLGPFILYVGKMSRRRNIPALIEGFSMAVHSFNVPHKLVLVGQNYCRIPIRKLAHDYGVAERLQWYTQMPEEDLPGLYAAADAFAYLSEWEGFGLPVLEAMAAGTPVLTLDRPIFREVAGEAAVYAPNADPEAIASSLARILLDHGLSSNLKEKGKERARCFSWDKTASQTLEILKEVAEGT